MVVQYRSPDVTLADLQTALAKSNTKGELLVEVDPGTPTSFGRLVYETTDPSGFAVTAPVSAVPRTLELLYVGLPAVIAGGPYYVVVVNKAGALAPGDRSVIPTPVIATAGYLFFWEPPDGFSFSLGIQVALSTTPILYTATATTCSVTCRTRNP